jgi:hypothetical protein
MRNPQEAFLEYLETRISHLTKLRETVTSEGDWVRASTALPRAHRPNPFNDFVSEQVKLGKTRKQAIRLYRRTRMQPA